MTWRKGMVLGLCCGLAVGLAQRLTGPLSLEIWKGLPLFGDQPASAPSGQSKPQTNAGDPQPRGYESPSVGLDQLRQQRRLEQQALARRKAALEQTNPADPAKEPAEAQEQLGTRAQPAQEQQPKSGEVTPDSPLGASVFPPASTSPSASLADPPAPPRVPPPPVPPPPPPVSQP